MEKLRVGGEVTCGGEVSIMWCFLTLCFSPLCSHIVIWQNEWWVKVIFSHDCITSAAAGDWAPSQERRWLAWWGDMYAQVQLWVGEGNWGKGDWILDEGELVWRKGNIVWTAKELSQGDMWFFTRARALWVWVQEVRMPICGSE